KLDGIAESKPRRGGKGARAGAEDRGAWAQGRHAERATQPVAAGRRRPWPGGASKGRARASGRDGEAPQARLVATGPPASGRHAGGTPALRRTVLTHPPQVANIVTTAKAIAAVDSQPMAQSGRGRVNWPITLGCIVMIIMTTISGTAATPLITAVQNSALIGSMLTKLMPTPITVPPTIVA